MSEARKKAEAAGRRGESLAALWLQLKGYQILKRRYKTKLGEIDLIARKGKCIAFIEVKHRSTVAMGLDSVTPRQSRRIENAAQIFMDSRAVSGFLDYERRYDIMVTGARWRPVHIADAWRP